MAGRSSRVNAPAIARAAAIGVCSSIGTAAGATPGTVKSATWPTRTPTVGTPQAAASSTATGPASWRDVNTFHDRAAQHIGHLVGRQLPGEGDPVAHPQLGRQTCVMPMQRVGPDERDRGVDSRRAQLGHRPHQQILVLDAIQAADVDESQRVRCLVRPRVEDSGVGAQRDDLVGHDAVRSQMVAHPLGGDGHRRRQTNCRARKESGPTGEPSAVADVRDACELASPDADDHRHAMTPADGGGDQPGKIGPQPVDHVGATTAGRGPCRRPHDAEDVGLAVFPDRNVDHVGVEETPLPRLRVVPDRQHGDAVVGTQSLDEMVDERDGPWRAWRVDTTWHHQHDPHRRSLAPARPRSAGAPRDGLDSRAGPK